VEDGGLTEYRIIRLEQAVETLATSTAELTEFMVSIRAWVRAIALLYGLISLVITGLLVKSLS